MARDFHDNTSLGPAEAAVVDHLRRRHFADVGVRFDPVPLLAELALQGAVPTPERQRAPTAGGWASVALRNRGGVAQASIEHDDEHRELPLSWTPLALRCPNLVAFLESLVDVSRCGPIHIMALMPSGIVEPHSDSPDRDVEVSLNLALAHPPGCVVRFASDAATLRAGGGEAVPYTSGVAMLLNVAAWHTIDNPTASPRVHLVIRASHRSRAFEAQAPAWWAKLAASPKPRWHYGRGRRRAPLLAG
ncbi:MAG: hypothetical protein RIT45_100 [Pseudomonadota bacterium]